MWRLSSQNTAKLWVALFIRALPLFSMLMREMPGLQWQERMMIAGQVLDVNLAAEPKVNRGKQV